MEAYWPNGNNTVVLAHPKQMVHLQQLSTNDDKGMVRLSQIVDLTLGR